MQLFVLCLLGQVPDPNLVFPERTSSHFMIRLLQVLYVSINQ